MIGMVHMEGLDLMLVKYIRSGIMLYLLHVGVKRTSHLLQYPGAGLADDHSTLIYKVFQFDSVYHSDTDPQWYGKTNGRIRRSTCGGSYSEAANGAPQYENMYGSRSTYCNLFSGFYGASNLSIRGCKHNLLLSWGGF